MSPHILQNSYIVNIEHGGLVLDVSSNLARNNTNQCSALPVRNTAEE